LYNETGNPIYGNGGGSTTATGTSPIVVAPNGREESLDKLEYLFYVYCVRKNLKERREKERQ
jgi:hypothetical protein